MRRKSVWQPVDIPHVDAALLRHDDPFEDLAELFIVHNHFVTRLLHSAGVDLGSLGLGAGDRERDPHRIWRTLAEHWHLFAATATGYWIEEELTGVLGVEEELGPKTDDRVPEVVGEHVWNLADFQTSCGIHRVDGNKKGVFTRDRRPKAAAHGLGERWTRIGHRKPTAEEAS